MGERRERGPSFVLQGQADDVFVGRQTELARIGDVWARMEAGEPWLVSIEGESGIGKTALATEAVRSSGATVLWARCDPAESDLQYGVIEQLGRGLGRNLLGDRAVLTTAVSTSSSLAVGAGLLEVIGTVLAAGPVVIIIDDVQWADIRSVEALSFVFRRLSVDPVLVMAVVRGDREHLDERVRRMLLSVPHRLHFRLSGLGLEDLSPLAAAVSGAPLDADSARRLFDTTQGHTLYVRTMLSDPESLARLGSNPILPRSLATVIGDQLSGLAADTRSLLEMLAVVDARLPLAILGDAAGISSPSAAIESAVIAGLVDWWPQEPTCPVGIRHPLQREAIYAGMHPGKRRDFHARAVSLVDDGRAWTHRVASLDGPDEMLASQLEQLAAKEVSAGQMAVAATHLLWASDISPVRVGRERRLLTAALYLTRLAESRGLELRNEVEASAPCCLRSGVLGVMAVATGQLAEAERRFCEALAEASDDPRDQELAAAFTLRLAALYATRGEGDRAKSSALRALDMRRLDPASDSQARTIVAVGVSQTDGVSKALAELAHLHPDPTRVEGTHADGLSARGLFHLLAGDLKRAVADLNASLQLFRKGVSLTTSLRTYSYLVLAQYFSGAWDDALLTAEQGLLEAGIHPRPIALPLVHLAATCVPAGRGDVEEAERHVYIAEQAAKTPDFSQVGLYSGMARALVCQAAGDYQGIAAALRDWLEDQTLEGRSRVEGVLWRPLLIEGLIGSGQHEPAAVALGELIPGAISVTYLQPALAWLQGWLEEEQGRPDVARQIYQQGEDSTGAGSPLYRARLLLAYGRLLRRIGERRAALERLRQANDLFRAFGARPLVAQTDDELAACGLPGPVRRRSVLEMTTREREVAYLIGQRMTNSEIAAELFITPKAVEYHLGNIYAKYGLKGRQQLRRFLEDARRPAPV